MSINVFEFISIASGNVSKILIGLGLLFLIVKVLSKLFHNNKFGNTLNKFKFPTYIFHKMLAIATILAIIHAFNVSQSNQSAVLVGWLTIIIMIPLIALGIIMGFSNNWVPFDEAQDARWKKTRIIKWILTFFMIGFLGLHFFV